MVLSLCVRCSFEMRNLANLSQSKFQKFTMCWVLCRIVYDFFLIFLKEECRRMAAMVDLRHRRWRPVEWSVSMTWPAAGYVWIWIFSPNGKQQQQTTQTRICVTEVNRRIISHWQWSIVGVIVFDTRADVTICAFMEASNGAWRQCTSSEVTCCEFQFFVVRLRSLFVIVPIESNQSKAKCVSISWTHSRIMSISLNYFSRWNELLFLLSCCDTSIVTSSIRMNFIDRDFVGKIAISKRSHFVTKSRCSLSLFSTCSVALCSMQLQTLCLVHFIHCDFESLIRHVFRYNQWLLVSLCLIWIRFVFRLLRQILHSADHRHTQTSVRRCPSVLRINGWQW